MSVRINGKDFMGKGTVTKYFSTMLWKYQIGETLNKDDEADVRFILTRHPQAREKFGCGIKRIFVNHYIEERSSKCFFVERLDGSIIDFSYLKCIHGEDISRFVNHNRRVCADQNAKPIPVRKESYKHNNKVSMTP